VAGTPEMRSPTALACMTGRLAHARRQFELTWQLMVDSRFNRFFDYRGYVLPQRWTAPATLASKRCDLQTGQHSILLLDPVSVAPTGHDRSTNFLLGTKRSCLCERERITYEAIRPSYAELQY